MVRLVVCALVLVATGVRAQEPIPDTTDWRAYFPLEIGNEWQFSRLEPQEPDGHLGITLSGWRIERDTTIEGQDYFLLRACSFEETEQVDCIPPVPVRYGDALILTRSTDGEEDWWREVPCGLDSDFGEPEGTCRTPGPEDPTFATGGGYDETVLVGTEMVSGITVKGFGGFAFVSHGMAAGIGLVGYTDESAPESRRLMYARVGSAEFGTPVFAFPTANESPPAGLPTLEATVYPNPAPDRFTLAFTLAEPANVEVVVYDVLGRRVVTEPTRRLGAGEQRLTSDVAALPAGVYFIRMTAGDMRSARRVVVR